MCIGSSKKESSSFGFICPLIVCCVFIQLASVASPLWLSARGNKKKRTRPTNVNPLGDASHTQSLSIFHDPQSQNRRHFFSLLLFFFQFDGWWWRETGVVDSTFNSRHSHIPSRHNRKKRCCWDILPTPFYLKVSAVDAFGSHKLFNWTDQPTRRDCYSLHLVYPVHIISIGSVTGWLRAGDVTETTRKSSTRRIDLRATRPPLDESTGPPSGPTHNMIRMDRPLQQIAIPAHSRDDVVRRRKTNYMYTTRKRERRRPIRRGPFGHGSQRQLRWYTCDVPRSAASHSNDIERERGSSRRRITGKKKRRAIGGANTMYSSLLTTWLHACLLYYILYVGRVCLAPVGLFDMTRKGRTHTSQYRKRRRKVETNCKTKQNKNKKKKLEKITTLLLAYIDENLTGRKCVSCWESKHSVLFACRRHSERIKIKNPTTVGNQWNYVYIIIDF